MAFLIGSFMPFIILLLLIIVHEIGHFLTAIFFKIEVDKIYIYPFGGVSKFNISLNESLLKEFLILIMGPLFQIAFYFIIINIDYFNNYINLITVYNYTILLFNLLPISAKGSLEISPMGKAEISRKEKSRQLLTFLKNQ